MLFFQDAGNKNCYKNQVSVYTFSCILLKHVFPDKGVPAVPAPQPSRTSAAFFDLMYRANFMHLHHVHGGNPHVKTKSMVCMYRANFMHLPPTLTSSCLQPSCQLYAPATNPTPLINPETNCCAAQTSCTCHQPSCQLHAHSTNHHHHHYKILHITVTCNVKARRSSTCCTARTLCTYHHRGTSLIRNNPSLGPYSKLMSRAVWWS